MTSHQKRIAIAILALMLPASLIFHEKGYSEDQANSTISADPKGIPEFRAEDPPPVNFAYVGTMSCAAAGCHGAPVTEGEFQIGREFTIWNSDAHSRAYAILFNKTSQKMAQRLKNVPGWENVVDKKGRSLIHRNERCLVCHATSASDLATSHRHSLSSGVGCESCHGPASGWLDVHKQERWKQFSGKQKEATGFKDTSNLQTRVQLCVDCHVGSSKGDVNHDLIAAGHPRLNFEMSAYQARMPQHWRRDRDIENNSSALEARLWAMGQVVTTKAAVNLLEQRATNLNAPWPELGEYDCYACHHELRDLSWRQFQKVDGQRPGALSWETWHTSMVTSAVGDADSASVLESLKGLRTEMTRPLPDREVIRRSANRTAAQLDLLAIKLGNTKFSNEKLVGLLRRVTHPNLKGSRRSWDSMTQHYLAAVAVRQSFLDAARVDNTPVPDWVTSVGKELKTVRENLLFPEDRNSPQSFGKSQIKAIDKSFKNMDGYFKNR